jgi:hypothetical protein
LGQGWGQGGGPGWGQGWGRALGRGGGVLFEPISLEPANSLGLPLAQADPKEAAPPVRARQRESLAMRRGQSLRLGVVKV